MPVWEGGPQGATSAGGMGLWCLLPRGRWSAGQSAGLAGNPQHRPPPPRESLPTAQCTAPQSVPGFHTILVTPHFRGAAASAVLPGGTPPATPPHTLLLRSAGAWVPGRPGGHSARGRPLPGVGTVTRLLLPLTSFFLHRSGQMQSRSSPASAGRAAPHGGRPRTLGSRGVLLGRPASLPPPGSALWPVSPAVPTWG